MSDIMKEKLNLHGLENLSFENICNEPIHPSILKRKMLHKYEIPNIRPYKGKEDLKYHFREFKFLSYPISNDDALMLWNFLMTLVGYTLYWYNGLPRHSVYSFNQLVDLFLEYFRINIHDAMSIVDLTKLQQFPYERVTDYISWWRDILTCFSYTLPQK